jgi:hypothetical protein
MLRAFDRRPNRAREETLNRFSDSDQRSSVWN